MTLVVIEVCPGSKRTLTAVDGSEQMKEVEETKQEVYAGCSVVSYV